MREREKVKSIGKLRVDIRALKNLQAGIDVVVTLHVYTRSKTERERGERNERAFLNARLSEERKKERKRYYSKHWVF